MKRTIVYISLTIIALCLIVIPDSYRHSFALAEQTSTQPCTSAQQHQQILHFVRETTGKLSRPQWLGWRSDGEYLAIAYDNDNTILIFDTKNVKSQFTINTEQFLDTEGFSLALSPDGNYLVGTFVSPNPVVKIWEISDSKANLFKTIEHTDDCCSTIYWSPDSKKITTLGFLANDEHWTLSTWDTHTGEQLVYSKDKRILSISPDDDKMLSYNDSLELIDAVTFDTLAEFPTKYPQNEQYEALLYYSWSNDSNKVAGVSCHRSGKCVLWVWDTKTSQLLDHFVNIERLSQILSDSMALSPSGDILAVAYLNIVNFWDVKTGKLLAPLNAMPDAVTAIA